MTRHGNSILRLQWGVAAAALLALVVGARPAAAEPHVEPTAKRQAQPVDTPVAPAVATPQTAPAPTCPATTPPAKPKAAKTPPPPAGEPLPFFGPRGALAPHVV